MPAVAPKLSPAPDSKADSKYDRRLSEILAHATQVFFEKGYQGASMRDLSRVSGMSLAGLYHYFDCKEKLLYLIQKHTFATIVDHLQERLKGVTHAEQRMRIFIRNHLEYFLANQQAMKVLSHEGNLLTGDYGAEVAEIKREYYRVCASLVDDLHRAKGLELPTRSASRIAVLSLFGMINWIYTWHNPKSDADASALAQQMGDIFLNGITKSARS